MIDIKSSYALLEKILVLKKSTLFATISTSELRAVASVAEEHTFNFGEHIVEENEIGDALYLIVHGTVRIVKSAAASHPVELAVLAAGDCFGEMSAIDEEVRSATACAGKECSVLRISKDNLLDVLRESPHIGIELLRIFVKRLRSTDKQIATMSISTAQEHP